MKKAQKFFILMGFAFLAACQAAPPPVVVAPPPVVIAPPVIPPIPVPPLSAAIGLSIPPVDIDGTRSSPNKNLGPEETIWHLRSSYNVAALTCQGPVWGQIATNYNAFLDKHKSRLNVSNLAIEDKYQKENRGNEGRRLRDTHITSLYNYFALPPVKNIFCNSILEYSREILALESTDLLLYAQTRLPEIDAIFTNFYDSYAAYEIALADWQARYGTPTSATNDNIIFAPGT